MSQSKYAQNQFIVFLFEPKDPYDEQICSDGKRFEFGGDRATAPVRVFHDGKRNFGGRHLLTVVKTGPNLNKLSCVKVMLIKSVEQCFT